MIVDYHGINSYVYLLTDLDSIAINLTKMKKKRAANDQIIMLENYVVDFENMVAYK